MAPNTTAYPAAFSKENQNVKSFFAIKFLVFSFSLENATVGCSAAESAPWCWGQKKINFALSRSKIRNVLRINNNWNTRNFVKWLLYLNCANLTLKKLSRFCEVISFSLVLVLFCSCARTLPSESCDMSWKYLRTSRITPLTRREWPTLWL